MKLNRSEITIIAVGLIIALLGSLSVLWYIREFSAKSEEPNIPQQITDTTAEPVSSIELVDTGVGNVDIMLDVFEETPLTGVEIFLSKDPTLSILSVECGGYFECMETTIEENRVTIIALRPIAEAETPLHGTLKIATMKYDTASSGSISLNVEGIDRSYVTQIGSGDNIADIDEKTYLIGD